ncbi:MAG: class I SAM-dependent methyltransferase [Patescibacteria group bacterium]
MATDDVIQGYATTNDLAARRGLYEYTLEEPLTTYLLEYLRGFDGMKFCDVGCGYGSDAVAVQTRFPNAAVYGIDQSKGMIEAASKTDPRIHFSVSDASSLPIDTLFDRILVKHVLHLVTNPKQAIEHIISHLVPGGRAVFVLHSTQSQPKFTEWITWACREFNVTYTSRTDDFAVENQHDLFNGEHRQIEVTSVTQHIELTSAEPYVSYMSTQKRWNRPLNADEMQRLLDRVRTDINTIIAQQGKFTEVTNNGIVIVNRL